MEVASAVGIQGSTRFLSTAPPRKLKVPRHGYHRLRLRLHLHRPKHLSKSNASSVITSINSSTSTHSQGSLSEVQNIKRRCLKWQWKNGDTRYSINYFSSSSSSDDDDGDDDSRIARHSPPLLLVHGFGASIPHWRRNIKTLAQNYTVYAIDLLGFGASDKPPGFQYTMETWAQLILDFLNEVVKEPTVLIGNSVGSLACLIAASVSNQIQLKLLLEELCC